MFLKQGTNLKSCNQDFYNQWHNDKNHIIRSQVKSAKACQLNHNLNASRQYMALHNNIWKGTRKLVQLLIFILYPHKLIKRVPKTLSNWFQVRRYLQWWRGGGGQDGENKQIQRRRQTKLLARETIKANLIHRHVNVNVFYSERELKLLENKDDNESRAQNS